MLSMDCLHHVVAAEWISLPDHLIPHGLWDFPNNCHLEVGRIIVLRLLDRTQIDSSNVNSFGNTQQWT